MQGIAQNMKSAEVSKLNRLEYIRGAAAVYVFMGHYLLGYGLHLENSIAGLLFRFGQEAVIVFFLLSGFVIHFSTTRKGQVSFQSYFLARFLRIYPLLFLVFAVSYGTNALMAGHLVDPDLLGLVGNIFMLQDFSGGKPNVIVDPYMGNAPLWSLMYEWWFYMMYYPLMVVGGAKRRRFAVWMIPLLGVASYIYIPNQLSRVMAYFAIWWVGVLLAEIYITKTKFNLRSCTHPLGLLLLCTIGLLANAVIHQSSIVSIGVYPLLEVRHFIAALILVMIALLWRQLGWRMFDRIFSPFGIFAPSSYALYISHVPLIQLTFSLVDLRQHWMLNVPIIMAILFLTYTMEKCYHTSISRILFEYFSSKHSVVRIRWESEGEARGKGQGARGKGQGARDEQAQGSGPA